MRVPRGPHAGTRANPAALTDRELDVARLLEEGLSDADIARRLRIRPKTVGHHVSHILSKLRVRSRHKVAAALGESTVGGRSRADRPPASGSAASGSAASGAGASGSGTAGPPNEPRSGAADAVVAP
ncbi:MAG: response regulator transcription factor [Acidimicrobiales bacterium]